MRECVTDHDGYLPMTIDRGTMIRGMLAAAVAVLAPGCGRGGQDDAAPSVVARAAAAEPVRQEGRMVAVTFDDLPAVAQRGDLAAGPAIVEMLGEKDVAIRAAAAACAASRSRASDAATWSASVRNSSDVLGLISPIAAAGSSRRRERLPAAVGNSG